MTEPAIRLFRDLGEAEAARQAILDAGFPPEAVELTSQGDEAGGVKGNFYIGDHTPRGAFGDEQDRYDRKFQEVDFAAVCVLTVHAASPAEYRRAVEMLERAGGRSLEG